MSSFKWSSAKNQPVKKHKAPRLMKMSDSFSGPHEQGKKEETLLFSSQPPDAAPKESAPLPKSMEYPPIGHMSLSYRDHIFRDPPATSSPVAGNAAPALPPRREPSPPLIYGGPPVPPRSGMVFDSTDTALPVQSTYPSLPLEFIGSKPAAEDRGASSVEDKELPSVPAKGWAKFAANSSMEKKKKPPIERRRSDSQGNATFYRSNSPVSQSGRLTPINRSAVPEEQDGWSARLPVGSNGSRDQQQQQQYDPGKKESASILDELMKRYERKEAEMRKTHEKELRKQQKDHDQTVDRLKEELSVAKKAHAGEMDKLKQETKHLEINWRNTYEDLAQHKQAKDQVIMEKEKQEAELRRERDEKEQLVAEMKAKYETLDKTKRSQIDGLEQDVRALEDRYKNELAQCMAYYEHRLREGEDVQQKATQQMRNESDARVAELSKEIAELRKEAVKLNAQLAAQTEEVKKIKTEKDQLQTESSLLRTQCIDLRAKYSKQMEEASKRQEKWKEQTKMIMEQSDRRIKEARDEGDKQRDLLQERLQAQDVTRVHEMEMREANFRDQIDKMRRDHDERLAVATRDLKQRILSLESDLIDNGDDMRPSLGGGALQTRYRALKLKVETITEPFNLAPPSGFDTSELDQREFLAREGKSQIRFLLRSVCWSIILDHFFSSPFGFGAFGREEGKKMLLEVYATWQRLFDPRFTGYIPAPELRGQEDFEPFYNDKFANWWRSATFQSIQSVVFPSRRMSQAGKPAESLDDNGSSRGPQGIVKAFTDNVEEAKRRVLDVITKVCKVDKVNEAIEREVDDMVRFASLLAVEFGAHGAKICFGMPTSGDTVQIGAEFVDCEDGDANRGKLETVELAVAPSLFMIGDGRKDLTTATCLFPGEIYPRRGD